MARVKTRKSPKGIVSHTVEVRYKGVNITQTFRGRETAAEAWGRDVESAIDNGEWPKRKLIPPHLIDTYFPPAPGAVAEVVDPVIPCGGWVLRQALEHYSETVTRVTKKGIKQEFDRINAWMRHPFADKRLDALTPADIQGHIATRLTEGRASSTIRNEIFLLSALYEHARKPPIPGNIDIEGHVGGWDISSLQNPTQSVVLPLAPRPRKRRLEDVDGRNEEGRLRAALAEGPNANEMLAMFTLAIETGMRLSELITTTVCELHRSSDSVHFTKPDSKNGEGRKVILSTRAQAVVDQRLNDFGDRADDNTRFISLNVPQLEYRWKLARTKAKIKGLTWHDLRHEGLSRMASRNLTLGELRAQSGHKSVQSLMIYLDAKEKDVSNKLG